MSRPLAALAAAASLAFFGLAARASVGFQHLTIPDPQGGGIEVGLWYPASATPKPERVELFTQDLAKDAAPEGRNLPLVVISHGTGGSYAGHADTAKALAEAGFVAAALTHAGDNWRDQTGAARIWERPRQLAVLTDYVLAAWPYRDRIDSARVGAFGFSAGGFTVLAAAGGEPDLGKVPGHCREHPGFFDCMLLGRYPPGALGNVAWRHDPRLKAIVVAAPAMGFAFGRDGLVNVRAPLQLWRASEDEILPHPFYAEAVRNDLPAQPEFHLVENGGHFDFLQPCPGPLAARNPAICSSRPGFDRAAFHETLNAAVVDFFRRNLGP